MNIYVVCHVSVQGIVLPHAVTLLWYSDVLLSMQFFVCTAFFSVCLEQACCLLLMLILSLEVSHQLRVDILWNRSMSSFSPTCRMLKFCRVFTYLPFIVQANFFAWSSWWIPVCIWSFISRINCKWLADYLPPKCIFYFWCWKYHTIFDWSARSIKYCFIGEKLRIAAIWFVVKLERGCCHCSCANFGTYLGCWFELSAFIYTCKTCWFFVMTC